MEQMNAPTLYNVLYEKLKGVSGLRKMYVGRTNDIQDAESRHRREGYNYTELIARGDVDVIREGEIYLIKKFKASDLNCGNDHDGGGPDKSNMLYVSYSCSPVYKTIYDLEDGDLDWSVVKLVK